MSELPDLRRIAAHKLGDIIEEVIARDEIATTLPDVFPAVDAIAEYAIALALDRYANAPTEAASQGIVAAILAKHAETLTPP